MKKASNEKRPWLRMQVLIVAITLVAVTVAILFSRRTYREIEEMATQQFNRQQLILARLAATGIAIRLEEIGEELPVLAEMPAVQAMTSECLTLMQLVYGEESRKASIRRLDKDGILRFIYPNEGWRIELVGRDYNEEAFFIEARETGERAISGLITNEAGEMHLRVAYPVFIEDEKGTREFNGVIVASFDIEELGRLYVFPIVSGQTGYAWLLNEEGIFLAHHEEGFTGRDAFEVRAERDPDVSYLAVEQIQRRMMAGEEGVSRYLSGWRRGQIGEVEKLIAYTPVHLDDKVWSVAVCAPVSEVEEVISAAHRSELYTLGFVIAALMTGGLCLSVASYRRSRSLEREVASRTRKLRQSITERVRAEESLRESEERLRTLIDTMPDFVCFKDGDGRWLEVNDAGIRLFRLEGVDYGGKKDSELAELDGFLRDTFLTCKETDARTWASPGLSRGEEVIPHPDGTVRVYDVIKVPVFHPDGERKGLVVLGRDITERVRAEEERARLLAQIQEQARQVQQIVDTMPEGVLLLDANMRLRLANPPARKYLALLTGDGAGEGGALTHLGDRPLAELLTSPPTGLWHQVAADGRNFEVIARPMENGPAPESWVLVIRDVTEKQEIQQRIQQQDRLAAVGQLTAGIAHDFNNIMAVIVLYTGLSLRLPDLPSKLRERLETISRQAKRATHLIQQMLDFSRRAVLERRPMDLTPFLKEQVKLLERALPESIKIELIYGIGEHTVNADPTRMQQVIMNLAVNARDAMTPEGGELCIGLKRIRIEDRKSAPLSELTTGEWVRVTVSDTGTGIPPEVRPHIFDPFFTTKERGQGTGLGLAQVHGIVKQHEGHIEVETATGAGTTFTIYLPALLEHQPEAQTPETSAFVHGQGETILVVEDDAALREAVVDSLELLNYRVLEAVNGREALAVLEQHSTSVDLVLSDVVMPEMGGIALFYALKQQYPAVKIVLLTGHPLEEELEGLQAKGLSAWLPKPPDPERLSQVLDQVLKDQE